MLKNQRLSALACLSLLFILSCRTPASLSQKGPSQSADATENLLSESGPTFRVSEAQISKRWSLIAYGDMRFTAPENIVVTNPKVRRWLVDRIAAERPDAVLLSGDVPYDGSVENDYAVYRKETEIWRKSGLRVYPAMGNHELHGDETREPKNWWSAFPELKGRRWYSVQFGNAYIIALDSNLPLTANSRQQNWLNDQLEHLPANTEFVFFSLHHPPVADPIAGNSSHNVRPNEHELAELLEKKAAANKAKFVVIAGHIHNYERFFENGVVYLVSGGGGAKPVPIARTSADLYQDTGFPNYHYLKFVYDGRQLQATMFRVSDPASSAPEWQEKDSFVIPGARH